MREFPERVGNGRKGIFRYTAMLAHLMLLDSSALTTEANIGECIKKFQDWLPGTSTANGIALCQ
jgi:hypothetical protein